MVCSSVQNEISDFGSNCKGDMPCIKHENIDMKCEVRMATVVLSRYKTCKKIMPYIAYVCIIVMYT